MFLFYTDETNLDPSTADFFVYGGVIVPAEGAKQLSHEIDALRARAGLSPDTTLKFNPRPPELNHEQFRDLKRDLVTAAINHGCRFIATLTHHRIATSPDEARRFAINTTAYHFECFLSREHSHGLVLIDRFHDAQLDAQLKDRFAVGVRDLPFSKTLRLGNIVGFHYSAIGQSHFGSLIDVVLGSFRFAINAFTRNDAGRRASADQILALLAPLFIRDDAGRVSSIGLQFSPTAVRARTYREQYEALRAYLSECGIICAQEIRAEAWY